MYTKNMFSFQLILERVFHLNTILNTFIQYIGDNA